MRDPECLYSNFYLLFDRSYIHVVLDYKSDWYLLNAMIELVGRFLDVRTCSGTALKQSNGKN